MTDREFVESACPHSWFLVADDLHGQAIHARKARGESYLVSHDRSTEERHWWDESNRACFLLAAFAVENALKGILVYENPDWISKGKLSSQLKSHDLSGLESLSKTFSAEEDELSVLQQLQDGNVSWARYPCGLSKNDASSSFDFGPPLWDMYRQTISHLGEHLIELLSSVWVGPHGFEGRYDIKGAFLE